MRTTLLKDRKGVTLVELLIAMALLLMVLSLGYSLYFFGTRSFFQGTEQAQLQQYVRIVDETLKRELRNVDHIVIEENTNGEENSLEELDYIKVENGTVYVNESAITEEGIITKLEVKIKDKADSEKFSLVYEIAAEADGQNYHFKNRVLLNNIPSDFGNQYIDFHSLKDFKLFYE